jgi:pantoate--beta-alanine ligase
VITVERIAGVRGACDGARGRGASVGLVPTMGAFHEGHRSLMRAARAANDFVVVSLFVNPTQFAPTEDLAAYPRDLERDAAIAAAEGADVLFTPPVDEMYRAGARTTVHVEGLTDVLCGASRPGHFDGVTTVVTKLFSIVGPCRAYFGRKDAQQLAVVRRMTADLDLPVEVVGCPLVREYDGLAMSSRNAYLSPDDRAAATVLRRGRRRRRARCRRATAPRRRRHRA